MWSATFQCGGQQARSTARVDEVWHHAGAIFVALDDLVLPPTKRRYASRSMPVLP